MAEREKVELNGQESVMLYESDREVSMDEIRENCEANDREVPEEGSEDYWVEVSTARDWDWEDFIDALKWECKLPANVLVTGHAGLWDGPHGTCTPVKVDDPVKFFGMFIPRCSEYELRIGYDKEGLFVEVPHHDGTNFYHVREITKQGLKYLAKCEDDYCTPVDIEKYTTPIDWRIT